MFRTPEQYVYDINVGYGCIIIESNHSIDCWPFTIICATLHGKFVCLSMGKGGMVHGFRNKGVFAMFCHNEGVQ